MRRIIFITGAGTGVASGIKTFRTENGLGTPMWDEYSIDRVCNYPAFISDPEVYKETHEFYNKRRVELATVEPNIAHTRMAELEHMFPGQVMHLTTNVDDLLERAGIDHDRIMHIHGYLPKVKLTNEKFGTRDIIDIGHTAWDFEKNGPSKPAVVFFGENAPLYQDLYEIAETTTRQDLVIEIGCSLQVVDFLDMFRKHAKTFGKDSYWRVNPSTDTNPFAWITPPEHQHLVMDSSQFFEMSSYMDQLVKWLEG